MEDRIFCANCNWQGTKTSLQEIWAANPNDPMDEYLTIRFCCPVCFGEDIKEMSPIKKPEKTEQND